MSYCTIFIKIPKTLRQSDVINAINNDPQFITDPTLVNQIASQFQYFSNIQYGNFFCAKRNANRMCTFSFNGTDIEIHCEVSQNSYKYNRLYEHGIKIIEDIENVLGESVVLTDFTTFDLHDEIIFRVRKYNKRELYFSNFRESWIDRFILLLISGMVVYTESSLGIELLLRKHASAISLYTLTLFAVPSFKANFGKNEKYKITYGGK